MVTKVLQKLLDREVRGLHDAAYVLAIFTGVSHILAIVRDRLLAHFFGASTALDVYYAAFRIPDFIFIIAGSTVSFFVLIPFILDRLDADDSREIARRFLSSLFSGFSILICVFGIGAFFGAPMLLDVLFPTLVESASGASLIGMTRIMLLSPILLGISNIFMSIAQVERRFFAYALSPVFYSFGIIAGILIFYPTFGLIGLAWGVVLGAVLHLLVGLPVAKKVGLMPHPTVHINWREIIRVFRVSLPRTAALTVTHGVFFVLVIFAARIAEGSVSVLNFSFNLQGVPLGIIGISYSVAAFPTLARFYSNGEQEKFLSAMITAIRHILFWSFPALVLFIVLRAHIVRTILGSGAFTWEATRLTAAVVALFVVSLAAQSLSMLFIRGYYAAGKTWVPLFINIASAFITMTLAYLGVMVFATHDWVRFFLESLMRVQNTAGTAVIMLSLAYSIGTCVQAGAFWLLFRKDFGGHFPRSLYGTVFRSLSASIIGGGATYGTLQLLDGVFNLDTFIGVFAHGGIAGLVGILVWVVVLFLLRSREVHEVRDAIHHKFWKVAPSGIEEV